MRQIFDIHTHIYPEAIAEKAVSSLGRFYNFVPQGKGTADDLMQDSGGEQRHGFLILSVATNARQVRAVNTFSAASVRAAREKGFAAYGFAGMHQDCPDMAAELCHALDDGLCGLKLHPDIQGCDLNDRRFYEAYEILSARGLPLCLHMGDDRPQYRFSEPQKLAALLRDFPSLRVCASHFGGYRATAEAQEYLYRNEQVFFDTSSSLWYLSREEALSLLSKMDTDRVMFGTDYPVMHLHDELALFDALGLPDAIAEKILFKNAGVFLANTPSAAADFA